MKIFNSTQTFDYPWDHVSAANWQKYPNEVSTHVVAVDVLRREFDPESQKLVTERLITCKQPIPSWLSFIVGGDNKSFIREISTVDRLTKTVVMRSCNMTMCKLLKVYETVTYTQDPLDLNKTKFEQTAEITAYASLRRLCDRIEDWSVERFGQNASKGKQGFDSVLKHLDEQWNGLASKTTSLLGEVNDKTTEVLKEVNEKTSVVLKEVNEKTNVVLKEVNEKTSIVLKEVNELASEIWKEGN
ncbi:hypothetical protein CANARDRAFT_7201 [[Candida] arabinofermentans NRRL YB-2248]|uniref:PRELI/MSF1 domain-containing protein n=1 Tax=[Candida] arabinofermentans NRRL YB-2248 TaxID=983967 RepID=A0A1E4T2B5_9ASCO|nr:hypothetical protein CANARDRAFT_7201 [[Candida] arabinofermentans NRRL YB-2248]